MQRSAVLVALIFSACFVRVPFVGDVPLGGGQESILDSRYRLSYPERESLQDQISNIREKSFLAIFVEINPETNGREVTEYGAQRFDDLVESGQVLGPERSVYHLAVLVVDTESGKLSVTTGSVFADYADQFDHATALELVGQGLRGDLYTGLLNAVNSLGNNAWDINERIAAEQNN